MVDPTRHARQLVLPGFGETAQRALTTARVLVIGAGGLGSAVLPQLVGAGVATAEGGRLGIIDDDVVALSNLHRQHLHTTADLGRLKVESAAERMLALDPAVRLTLYRDRFRAETALALLADYDLLVDGSDGFATRYLAADAAALRGIPLVWGSVLQFDGQVGVAPVGGPGFRDLFPQPPTGEVLDCATGGVLPVVCGVIGSLMAAQVIALITGVGTPLIGRVTTYNARTGRLREVAYGHDPEARTVTELTDAELEPRTEPDPGPKPAEILPRELAAVLERTDERAAPLLLDVREPWEFELVALPGAQLAPLGQLTDMLDALPRDRTIIAYCHHGIRSQHALQILRAAGFDARHLVGGIDAWASEVDPAMPRY